MSERRFTDKPDLNPEAVRSLPDTHEAMVGNRTLFPSTVVAVTADAPDRLLISGDNNRKIGATVEKGAFKGYAIFMLSLEERATCPADCEVRGYCYGNGMQMARRHRIGDPDVFYDRLGLEIAELLDEHVGLLIRLHVLGDFPDVEYVSFWKEVLDEYPSVACFGYTHRSPSNWGGDEIGDAIQAVKDAHPNRFRVRWSSPVSRDDGAIVIDYVPQKPRTVAGDIVCPAQTDATACCATCGLCWEGREPVAFIKHGPKSGEVEARGVMNESAKAYWATKESREPLKIALARTSIDEPEQPTSEPAQDRKLSEMLDTPTEPEAGHKEPVMSEPTGDRRRIHPLKLPPGWIDLKVNVPGIPEVRTIEPSTLIVEASYQRDLSGKSLNLIRKIVRNWDWAKFKPPVCAETSDGLFVIDGQHTAIAAASHPAIKQIPVMVVQRPDIEDRAAAFVSQNRDRITMSAAQVFHAECVAGDKTALGILRCVVKAGASVPRNPPLKGKAKPGEIVSVGALRQVYDAKKPEHLERVLRIAVLSGKAPVNSLLIRGVDVALKIETIFGGDTPLAEVADEEIAAAIALIENLEERAEGIASDAGTNKYYALAMAVAAETEENSENYGKLTGETALAS